MRNTLMQAVPATMMQCPKCGGFAFSTPDIYYIGKDFKWRDINYKKYSYLSRCAVCGFPIPAPSEDSEGNEAENLTENEAVLEGRILTCQN